MGLGVEFPDGGRMSYDSTECYSGGGSNQMMPNQHIRHESYNVRRPTSYHHESSYQYGNNMPHGYGSHHSSHSAGHGMSGSHGMTSHSSSSRMYHGMPPYGSGPMMTSEMGYQQGSFGNGIARGHMYDQRMNMRNGGYGVSCVTKDIED